MAPNDVPEGFGELLAAELRPDETILWTQEPNFKACRRRRPIRRALLYVVLLAAGVLLVCAGIHWSRSGAVPVWLWTASIIIGVVPVVVFVVVLVMLVCLRAMIKTLRALPPHERTIRPFYVLTDKRLILLYSWGSSSSSVEIGPEYLRNRKIQGEQGASGDIVFPRAPHIMERNVNGARRSTSTKSRGVAMGCVTNVREVDRLISETFGSI